MEFASEMIVKATLAKLRISDVPTILSPDGRSRPPHLRSWRDGWRHLRFLLMMSPRWLFLYPGFFLLSVGTLGTATIIAQPLVIGGIAFDIHTLLYAGAAAIIGTQLLLFSVITRAIGIVKRVLPPSPSALRLLNWFNLERGLILGLGIFAVGLSLASLSVYKWATQQFMALDPREVMRLAIPSVTFMVLGLEVVFASFVVSFIDAKSATQKNDA
jgi:hypothetical protein